MSATSRLERFFCDEAGEWFNIPAWPRWLRRTWVLTLPVSGPLYALVFLAMMIGVVMGFVAAAILDAWD